MKAKNSFISIFAHDSVFYRLDRQTLFASHNDSLVIDWSKLKLILLIIVLLITGSFLGFHIVNNENGQKTSDDLIPTDQVPENLVEVTSSNQNITIENRIPISTPEIPIPTTSSEAKSTIRRIILNRTSVVSSLYKKPEVPIWSRFYEANFTPLRVYSPTSCSLPLLHDKFINYLYSDIYEMPTGQIRKTLYEDRIPDLYNNSAVMNMIKKAYKKCLVSTDCRPSIYKMMASMTEGFPKEKSKKSIAKTIALFQKEFGVNTFFKFEVLPNFQDPHGDHPYLIYLSPNSDLNKYRSLRSKEEPLEKPYILYFQLSALIFDCYNQTSSDWDIVDLKNLDPGKYNFDFRTYFETLLEDLPDFNLDKMKFVIIDPDYVKKFIELISRTEIEDIKSFMLNSLKDYFYANLEDCTHIIEKYTPHFASVIYLSGLQQEELKVKKEMLLNNFHLLTKEMEKVVADYLDNEEQRNFVKEKLQNVGITIGEPGWFHVEDVSSRLDQEYKDLHIPENSTSLEALLQMAKFSFNKSINYLKGEIPALRDSAFESISMSEMKMDYSRTGNWIHVPVASFMAKNEKWVVFKLAQQVAKVVDSESFKFSQFGTQRFRSSNKSKELIPKAILGQEQCFRVHGLIKDDFSLAVGIEIAYKVLVKNCRDMDSKKEVAVRLFRYLEDRRFYRFRGPKVSNYVESTIAAGFLEHIEASYRCTGDGYLPCFISFKEF